MSAGLDAVDHADRALADLDTQLAMVSEGLGTPVRAESAAIAGPGLDLSLLRHRDSRTGNPATNASTAS